VRTFLIFIFIGNELLLFLGSLSGDMWSSHRKYLQPSFKTNILEKFIDTFTDSSNCLLEKLNNAPTVIDVTPFVNVCVLDILNGKFDIKVYKSIFICLIHC
jgi:hypothetical protein